MKIDRRGIEPPKRDEGAREAGARDRRDESSGFDALVAALARPETKPRPEARDARHGSEVRRRETDEDAAPERDVDDELDGEAMDVQGARDLHGARDRDDRAVGRDARSEAQTMPPDVAAFVRFASETPHDASGFRPAPPPLPWTKGGRDWRASAAGEGKLPAPPRAPSLADAVGPSDADGPGGVGESANVLDASDADVADAAAPNAILVARPRFAWRAPVVREPVARPDAVGDGPSVAAVTNDALVNPASMGSTSVSDGAWLGPTRLSDEAHVSLALAAREERRGPRVGDPEGSTELRPEGHPEGHAVLDVTPSVVRGVTAVLEAATAEPSVGDALMRAASRFAHEDSTIRLSHPELGRVRLQIAMEGDGIDVRAFAESALAARILSESEETLRREIARHGVSLRRMKVRVETSDGARREDVTPSTARPPRRHR